MILEVSERVFEMMSEVFEETVLETCETVPEMTLETS